MPQRWIFHFILQINTENIHSWERRVSSKSCDLWVTSSKQEKKKKEEGIKADLHHQTHSAKSQLWSLKTAGLSPDLSCEGNGVSPHSPAETGAVQGCLREHISGGTFTALVFERRWTLGENLERQSTCQETDTEDKLVLSLWWNNS